VNASANGIIDLGLSSKRENVGSSHSFLQKYSERYQTVGYALQENNKIVGNKYFDCNT